MTESSSDGHQHEMDDLISRLRAHVEALTMVRHAQANPEGLRVAREYIGTHLRSAGFQVVERQVPRQPPEERNVIAHPAGAYYQLPQSSLSHGG